MRAKARTCSRGVGLYGEAFVEEPLLVDLAQQPPQRLDVAVVVGDVGVLHVDPVAHLAGQLLPFLRVLHHLAAAGGIIFVYADLLPDVLLGDTEGLLYA